MGTRTAAALISLGLAIYVGSALTSGRWDSRGDLGVFGRASMVAKMEAGRYVLNVRSGCPLRFELRSALTGRAVVPAREVGNSSLEFEVPAGSVYSLEFSPAGAGGCEAAIWLVQEEGESRLARSAGVAVAAAGLILGAASLATRRGPPRWTPGGRSAWRRAAHTSPPATTGGTDRPAEGVMRPDRVGGSPFPTGPGGGPRGGHGGPARGIAPVRRSAGEGSEVLYTASTKTRPSGVGQPGQPAGLITRRSVVQIHPPLLL